VYFAPFRPVFQVGEIWIASADSHRPSRHRGALANNRRADFKIDKIVMPGPKNLSVRGTAETSTARGSRHRQPVIAQDVAVVPELLDQLGGLISHVGMKF
jgi:hypothetical protein